MKNRNALVLFALSLLFFSVLSISVNAAETYVFETKWGSYGTGDGRFSDPYPYGVAVDSSGNVYVADFGNNRIQKFDSNGGFITKWGSYGNGDGWFGNPYGVAVDSSGNVYAADSGNSRIQKFDSNGGFITKWGSSGTGDGQFNDPFGVAVDSSGNVYVTDYYNHRIQKFNSNGGFMTKWGSDGTVDGQFKGFTGVAVDSSGNVYAADSGNNRIQKFDSNGRFITKWGSLGSGDGQFKDPFGVAVDSSGNVYVTDYHNNRIQKFDSNGGFITKWGSYGFYDGQFSDPYGVAVDSSGNVYVTDILNHRIQKFSRMLAAAAVMSTATLPPQYIISVHEGGNSEGILQIVHDDNSEGMMSKMSTVVPAPGAALGASIENARVRVGGDPFITTDSNGRTPAFVAKERDSVSIAKRGYKSLRITIPPKEYTDRFSGIVVQLKKQLGPAAPLSVPAPSIRTPVGP